MSPFLYVVIIIFFILIKIIVYLISHVMSLSFYKFASAARHNNIASESMTTKTKILDNKKMSPKF